MRPVRRGTGWLLAALLLAYALGVWAIYGREPAPEYQATGVRLDVQAATGQVRWLLRGRRNDPNVTTPTSTERTKNEETTR